jgi:hypothetical protein
VLSQTSLKEEMSDGNQDRGSIASTRTCAAASLSKRKGAAGRDHPEGARLIFLAGLFGGLIVLIALAIYLGIVS